LLNLKQEIRDYQQIGLDDIVKKEPHISDDMRSSILLYNKALINLKQNSEDIAIIELKKSISLNPSFVDAMNLLGVCYLSLRDYERAMESFEKVLSIDNMNESATRYIDSIPSIMSRGTRREASQKNVEREPSKEANKESNKRVIRIDKPKMSWKSQKMNILFRFAVAVLVILILIYISGIIIASINSGKNNSNNQLSLQDYIAENKNLKNEINTLKETIKENETKVAYSQGVLNLIQAERLSKADDPVGAADLLVLLKTVEFSGQEKTEYDILCAGVFPIAADKVFQDGYDLYQSGHFREALASLDKVAIYTPVNDLLARTLYYIGKSHMGLNDNISATNAFNRVISEYPSSIYAGYAEGKLQSITTVPTSSPITTPTTTN
jgi:tetratricopeptide (TPR) repeat protein